MEKPFTFYRIPNDGAPFKCYECGQTGKANPHSPNPFVKLAGIFGARHLQCVKDLSQYTEVSAPGAEEDDMERARR